MLEVNIALEEEAGRWRRLASPHGAGRKARRLRDQLFARIAARLEARIAMLIRRYGMRDIAEDAHQACLIGIYRALESHDPARARFSTHVTWQMRGELQSLRHRMRLDQRQSARSAGISTVSIEALGARRDEDAALLEIVDDAALANAESAAREAMTQRCILRLMEAIGSPAHERAIVLDHLFEREPGAAGQEWTSEQRRQIVRRTFRNCAKRVALSPRAPRSLCS